jgi:hypothetical protein
MGSRLAAMIRKECSQLFRNVPILLCVIWAFPPSTPAGGMRPSRDYPRSCSISPAAEGPRAALALRAVLQDRRLRGEHAELVRWLDGAVPASPSSSSDFERRAQQAARG